MLTVRAKDADLGEPRPLSLTLEGDYKGFFILEEVHQDSEGVTNAVIVTSDKLLDREDSDIENNGGLYTFSIKVTMHLYCYSVHCTITVILLYCTVE